MDNSTGQAVNFKDIKFQMFKNPCSVFHSLEESSCWAGGMLPPSGTGEHVHVGESWGAAASVGEYSGSLNNRSPLQGGPIARD